MPPEHTIPQLRTLISKAIYLGHYDDVEYYTAELRKLEREGSNAG